jgi:hypothetical protein
MAELNCSLRRLAADQLGQETGQLIVPPFGLALLDRNVVPLDEAGLGQASAQRRYEVLQRRRRRVAKQADDRHRRLLRWRSDGPRHRRAAEHAEKFASPHGVPPLSAAREDEFPGRLPWRSSS